MWVMSNLPGYQHKPACVCVCVVECVYVCLRWCKNFVYFLKSLYESLKSLLQISKQTPLLQTY